MELAWRNFPKPVEIFSAKPSYTGWQQPGGEKAPSFFETTWIGHHSQMGSLPNGHADPPGMNLNGFRLLGENQARGADTLIVFTSLQWSMSHATATCGGDQIAQYRGNLIWMNEKPDCCFYFFLPRSAAIVNDGPRVFIRLEKTWVALHLINSKGGGIHAEATAKACGPKRDGEAPQFPDDHVWSAAGGGAGPCGFALEIGEPQTHGDFNAFRRSVTEKARLDLGKAGEVHLAAASGERVGLRLVPKGMPRVFRNGSELDWKSRWPLWSGEGSPVSMGWRAGELKVKAGGREFTARLP